ncbi:MAG: flagellar hook-basal body complex protein FliE [Candidatus Eremiobacteraeota bacterium]|nr:flagellar hook-basal body complex protein FliE [Candidatus Eremiobacteraeota bacterium]
MDIPTFDAAVSKTIPGTFVPDVPATAPRTGPIPDETPGVAGAETPTFRDTLKGLLEDVSDRVTASDKNSRDLATGKTTDIEKVITSVEEANLSMQFTLAVRNKILDAYKEITAMQV